MVASAVRQKINAEGDVLQALKGKVRSEESKIRYGLALMCTLFKNFLRYCKFFKGTFKAKYRVKTQKDAVWRRAEG